MHYSRWLIYGCLIGILSSITSCGSKEKKLFTIRSGATVGIDFQNRITENDTLNAVTFEYMYNGAGVGVGDFNNDGLEDIFFGGNQVSSELYLNQGNLQFKKITNVAGLATSLWITGVSVVDINRDGWLDVYLSAAGKTKAENRRNLLFINDGVKDGVPHFTESAKSYGLDDDSYHTMAVFFDFDKDNDLDVYLVNNWLEKFNRNNLRTKRTNGEAESTDKLFRNNGNNTFTNISREAGILIEGYGLGAAVCDLNQDGWPDIYVSNDFVSNDLVWINQKNGTFRNQASEFLKHQSFNAMGVDISDVNNDGLPDIAVVDMLPEPNSREKMMQTSSGFDFVERSRRMSYQLQYVRNTLQLNRGTDTTGRTIFSDISFLAGVAKTDWSWAPLFADFDNDGFNDLFIANGYRRDITNLDFVFFSMNNFALTKDKYREKLNEVPEVKVSNYIFKNAGNLRFVDKTDDWGLKFPDYTNGAAYADFDRDGDLDLITNNIDQEVTLFENKVNEIDHDVHFIDFKFSDPGLLNEKIYVYSNGEMQFKEFTPYRGFQSTVTSTVHFGLKNHTSLDSVIIQWPDQKETRLKNIQADKTYSLSHKDAKPGPSIEKKQSPIHFEKETIRGYVHSESSPIDFKITRTLTHELTKYGPCVTVGDVNGDGVDDFFVGGEKNYASKLFIQKGDDSFEVSELATDSEREDGSVLFFDKDSDGDLDLFIAASCSSPAIEPKAHQLYENDGSGKFSLTNSLPQINSSTACVQAADIDGDGDQDLFLGGRIKPKEYPFPSRSYVLRNDKGKFTDITHEMNPLLEFPGLVSSAVWADYNNDDRLDLIIAGEWMPIRIFRNDLKKFTEVTDELNLGDTNGWWNCVIATDLNKDGFVDIVGGNNGVNGFLQPTLKEPVQIVVNDFDNNGTLDPIVTYYNSAEKDRFILHSRLTLLEQLPKLKSRFRTFAKYATTPFRDVFSPEELKGAITLSAKTFASTIFLNRNGQRMEAQELPSIAQVSTVNDILADDVNGDGHRDLILIGNSFAQEPTFGPYDASVGTILINNGSAGWREIDPIASNFLVETDARFIKKIRSSKSVKYLVGSNQSPLFLFERRK